MKKFLVVLLSLGLIAALAAPVSAADVKVAGTYIVQGAYSNNPTMRDDGKYSVSAVYNQIRMQPVFQVAEGLAFTMRFDAMEKIWGDSRWKGGTDDGMNSRPALAPAGVAQQQNIELEHGWVTFKTAIGQFDIGYQNRDGWGTRFFNQSNGRPTAQFTSVFGPVTMNVAWEKRYDTTSNWTAGSAVGITDGDYDTYSVAGIYKWNGGAAGLLYKYWLNKVGRTAGTPFTAKIHQVSPYVTAKFGPVAIEAEVMYFFGKTREFEVAGTDQDAETLNAAIKAQYNMGPAYFGAQFAYASGNDPSDPSKEKELNGLGIGWDCTLILGSSFHGDIGYDNWIGGVNGTVPGRFHKLKKNMTFYNLFGGYKLTPKIAFDGSVTYAVATEKPLNYDSDKIGIEVDLGVTYKIYDNLSYYVAAGYLFAGDYWKGAVVNGKYDDNYVLLNKLTLSF